MSFLSLDTEGRVLRLDSFSKVLAPGFRIGWVTGPPALIKAYNGAAYFEVGPAVAGERLLLYTVMSPCYLGNRYGFVHCHNFLTPLALHAAS